MTAQEPEWRAVLERAKLDDGKQRHLLRKGQRLSAELLWELEHQLVAFLEGDGAAAQLDLLDRVRCCLRYAELATTGKPETEAGAMLRQAMAAGIPAGVQREPAVGRMNDTQRAIFFQWTFLHVNPAPVDHDLLDPA